MDGGGAGGGVGRTAKSGRHNATVVGFIHLAEGRGSRGPAETDTLTRFASDKFGGDTFAGRARGAWESEADAKAGPNLAGG